MNGIGGLQFKTSGLVLDMAHQPGLTEPHATAPDDYSSHNQTITFKGNGEPDWVRLATGLWAMRFNATGTDDYVNCGNAKSLDDYVAVTYLAWIRPALEFGAATYQIFDKRDGGNIAPTFLWHITNHLYLFASGTVATGTITSLSADTWYFVAGVA